MGRGQGSPGGPPGAGAQGPEPLCPAASWEGFGRQGPGPHSAHTDRPPLRVSQTRCHPPQAHAGACLPSLAAGGWEANARPQSESPLIQPPWQGELRPALSTAGPAGPAGRVGTVCGQDHRAPLARSLHSLESCHPHFTMGGWGSERCTVGTWCGLRKSLSLQGPQREGPMATCWLLGSDQLSPPNPLATVPALRPWSP